MVVELERGWSCGAGAVQLELDLLKLRLELGRDPSKHLICLRYKKKQEEEGDGSFAAITFFFL